MPRYSLANPGDYDPFRDVPRRSSGSRQDTSAYDPRNPQHILLDGAGKVLSLPLHEIAQFRERLVKFLTAMKVRNPAHGEAGEKLNDKIRAKYHERLKGANREGKKQLIIQMQNERRAAILEHQKKVGNGQEQFNDLVNEWKDKHRAVLEVLTKLRPGAKLFFASKLGDSYIPVEDHSLAARVQAIVKKAKKYNLLERGHWKWSDEGKDMLRQAGFDLDEMNRDFELKGNSPLAVQEDRNRRELDAELQQTTESLGVVRAKLKARQKDVDKGLEWLAGKTLTNVSEQEKKLLTKGNARLGLLLQELRHLQDSLLKLEDHEAMLRFQMGQKTILNIPLEPEPYERARLIEEAYATQKWSTGLTPDQFQLLSGKYAGKALRDIPVDYLVWIATGARIEKKRGVASDRGVPLEIKKIYPASFAGIVFRRVREYLETPGGRKRLRDYYGPVGEEYVKTLVMGERERRSAIIAAGLKPQDKDSLRRQLQESLKNFNKEGQAMRLYEHALNLGMSPEEAARYVEWAEKETPQAWDKIFMAKQDPEAGKWHVPVAFQESGHLRKEERQEIREEDFLTERDYLRRQLAQLTPEEFMLLMWPPADKKRGYRDDELGKAKAKYYSLRSHVLQTPVGEKAGWVPHDPKWRALDPQYPQATAKALEILDMVEQAETRPQLEDLRKRLIELFHSREDAEEDALTARENKPYDPLSMLPKGTVVSGLEAVAMGVNPAAGDTVDVSGFEEGHDSPLIQFIHNRIVERYNLFAHPDVQATPISYEENEALSQNELPFPEAELPETSAFINPGRSGPDEGPLSYYSTGGYERASPEDIAGYRKQRGR